MRVRYDTKELIWKIWSAARLGQMITLIGPEIGIDEFAAAVKSTGREVLSHLGSRFHRIYYAD
jgi:alanine racemase